MRLEDTVTINLKADEAIVLGYFLSRELWNRGEERLNGCVEHVAETHALHAVLQELVPILARTGGAGAEENTRAARASLMARYT